MTMDQVPPQMQNPNVLENMPVQSPMDHITKKKGHWILVAVAIAAVATFFVIQFYIDQMVVEMVVRQPVLNQEAREDALISNEVQDVDLGDLNTEFEDIDKDLNSL